MQIGSLSQPRLVKSLSFFLAALNLSQAQFQKLGLGGFIAAVQVRNEGGVPTLAAPYQRLVIIEQAEAVGACALAAVAAFRAAVQ